jgi:hypothetical protein
MDVDSFRREHALLGAHVEHLRLAAREIPDLSLEERRELLTRVVEFLGSMLLHHADEEELHLYPLLAAEAGEAAVAALREEHAWIRRRVHALAAVELDDHDQIQELLYALHTIVSLHFWKEEELLPLLEAPAA